MMTRKPRPPVADHGAEADVVDGAGDAVVPGAAVEGDLEFARQVAGEVLAKEGVGDALRVGAHVEDFVGGKASPGACGDVADRVVAGLPVGEPDIGEQVHEVGDALQGDEVILDVLAGGEVALAAAELVGDAGELVDLAGGEQSAGYFASHHLDAGLSLAVNAVFEAEGAESVFRDLAGEEGLGPVTEGFDLFADGLRAC